MTRAGQHQAPIKAGIDPRRVTTDKISPNLSLLLSSEEEVFSFGKRGRFSLGGIDQVPFSQSSMSSATLFMDDSTSTLAIL